jgi:hypothetical protein
LARQSWHCATTFRNYFRCRRLAAQSLQGGRTCRERPENARLEAGEAEQHCLRLLTAHQLGYAIIPRAADDALLKLIERDLADVFHRAKAAGQCIPPAMMI